MATNTPNSAPRVSRERIKADDIVPLNGSQALAVHEHFGAVAAGAALGGGIVGGVELGWNTLVAHHPVAWEFLSKSTVENTGKTLHGALAAHTLGAVIAQGAIGLILGTAFERAFDHQINRLHGRENQTVLKVEGFLTEHQKMRTIARIVKSAASYGAGFWASGELTSLFASLGTFLSKAGALKLSLGALAFIPNPAYPAVIAAVGLAFIGAQMAQHRRNRKKA